MHEHTFGRDKINSNNSENEVRFSDDDIMSKKSSMKTNLNIEENDAQ